MTGTHVKPAARVGVLMVAGLLAGCGVPSSRHAPATASPTHVAHHQQMRLPLSFSQMAMGSTEGGWALPAEKLGTGDARENWTGLGPPGVPPESPLGEQGQIAGASGLMVAESFPAPQTAVVATKTPSGATVHVYETTDGGRQWSQSAIRLPASQAANLEGGTMHLQFVSPREGWVFLSSQGFAGTTLDALVETSDGGRRWRLLQSARTPPGQAPAFEDVQAVAFQRSGWGLATVNSPAFDSAPVLTTTNGGITWAVTQLPLPTTAAQTQAVEGAPSLSASQVAWVPVTIMEPSGHAEQLVLYATADGGRHWTFRPWPTPIPLTATFVLVGSRIFIAGGQRTAEYQLSLNPAGALTWHHLATWSTLSPTAAALAAMSGAG